MSTCIKVCIHDQCDAVWHECPPKVTRCPDCEGYLVRISRKWYDKKFRSWPIQLLYSTGELLTRPLELSNGQLTIFE